MDEKLEPIYADVVRRNPGEVEFHESVRQMLSSLGPLIAKRPELLERKLIERICEPERQIIFRVPWQDDRGRVHINRGPRGSFGLPCRDNPKDAPTTRPMIWSILTNLTAPGGESSQARFDQEEGPPAGSRELHTKMAKATPAAMSQRLAVPGAPGLRGNGLHAGSGRRVSP